MLLDGLESRCGPSEIGKFSLENGRGFPCPGEAMTIHPMTEIGGKMKPDQLRNEVRFTATIHPGETFCLPIGHSLRIDALPGLLNCNPSPDDMLNILPSTILSVPADTMDVIISGRYRYPVGHDPLTWITITDRMMDMDKEPGNVVTYNFRGHDVFIYDKEKRTLDIGDKANLCSFTAGDALLMAMFLLQCHEHMSESVGNCDENYVPHIHKVEV